MNELPPSTWYQDHVEPLIAEHGMFPPPWIYLPEAYPYSIAWRMGGGESFIGRFWQWWNEAQMSEAQRIEYFKYFSPPPRWYEWVADAIWDLDPFELEEPETFDYQPYFERLSALGFEGVDQFKADLQREDS
ncbi:hypothetical protein [Thiofilum flexile]|uniref:hypothetical protein n=1 Tax=Thiofilum flexile TaxID=125627 RepID=UPI00036DE9C8|nr:hypothetical protein [Thiofilum flexile]